MSPRENLIRLHDLYNTMTGFVRPLPHFIIIGAQKAGTTSLFHYLSQHPQVLENKSKEIHFFDKFYDKGPNWYRCHFPLLGRVRPKCRLGEATPYYFCHPHAPRRIHELIPDVKLIVVLRNPTDRAISHYFHELKKGRENLPLFEALNSEEKRCDNEWQKMIRNPDYISRSHQSFSYKQRGRYIEQFQEYHNYFPKEQLHIVSSEDLFTRPHTVLESVFTFLGVDPLVKIGDVAVKNANPIKKDVPKEVYDYLGNYFEPFNKKLYHFLDLDMGW